MVKIRFNLRKMALMVTCLAGTVMFFGCEDNRGSHDDYNYMVLVDYDLMVMKHDMGKSTWSGARDICKQVRLGGFSDWRLPTQRELSILYLERNVIGGFETFNNTKYWSSEPSAVSSFYMCLNFTNGYFERYIDMSNHPPLAVRCVRNASRIR